MNEIPRQDLLAYLRRFIEDLQRFQPSDLLPWSVARIFNELLKQTKLELGAHPLANTVSSIKEHYDQELNPGASAASVGAVLAILGQLLTGLELTGDNAGVHHSDVAFDLVEDDAR